MTRRVCVCLLSHHAAKLPAATSLRMWLCFCCGQASPGSCLHTLRNHLDASVLCPVSAWLFKPPASQICDVTAVVAARAAAALFCVANALVLLSGCNHPLGRLSVLAAAVVLLSPVPPLALELTRSFRLNEALSKACRWGA
jgi:hypothetical protein